MESATLTHVSRRNRLMLSPISEYMHNAQTTLCQRADRADDASEAHGIRDEDDILKTTIPLGW